VNRVDPTGMRDLRAWMDGFWQEALDTYAEAARKDAAQADQSSMAMRKGLPDE
jgi:hypothetical protein